MIHSRAIGCAITPRFVSQNSLLPCMLRLGRQAMDIAGLSKLSADTLVLIVSVLGFLVSVIWLAMISLRLHMVTDLWLCY